MKVVLVRVGLDSGSGGGHSPLFVDGTFEVLPIPDGYGIDARTYGNTIGRHGRALSEYFPASRRAVMASQSMHVDPEWQTFTYGDPTVLKRGLGRLQAGDLLIFYCGLQRWDEEGGFDRQKPPALFIAGYFEVALAGMATDFSPTELQREFGENFHVKHRVLFDKQKNDLVLVKGGSGSRLLKKAHQISVDDTDKNGVRLHRLSSEAQVIFGDFEGKTAIQRSSPRSVVPEFVATAAKFVRGLE